MEIEIDKQMENPLVQSYLDNDIDKFRQLIKEGMNVNCLYNNRFSLIELIIRNQNKVNDLKFFNTLIENKVKIDPVNGGPNLLFTTLLYKQKDYFKELIDSGFDVNSYQTQKSSTHYLDPIIFRAMTYGYYYTDLLMKKHIDVNVYRNDNETVLNALIKASRDDYTIKQSLDIFQRCIDYGADVNDRGFLGMQPIHSIVCYKLNHFFDILLNDNIKVELNSRDREGDTALIYSVKYNNFEACELLIKKGANLNIFNKNNESVFLLSAAYHNTKIFDFLLSNNAAKITIDSNNCNILHSIIDYEWNQNDRMIEFYVKIVKKHPELLLKKNNDGKTPLDLLDKYKNCEDDKKFYYKITEMIRNIKTIDDNGISL